MHGCNFAAASDDGVPKPEGSTQLYHLHLTCNADSFRLIQERFSEDIYISSTVECDGRRWEGVRLRLRGDSSREFPKKSMKLKFSKKSPFLDGRKTLNLNGEFLDPTYMRQALVTRLFAANGLPCFSVNHAVVHVNGVMMGIYAVVENVDAQFMERVKLAPESRLYKATRDGACLSEFEDFRVLWENKSAANDSDWAPLATLIAQLNQTSDADYHRLVHTVFVYDELVTAIALNMLVGNRSTYYHNYFICREPQSLRWRYLPWDLDNTFVLKSVKDLYQRGNLSDWGDAFMASNPMFERALVTPGMLGDIQRRVSELIDRHFQSQYLDPVIDGIAAQLIPYVPADTLFSRRSLSDWKAEVESLKEYIRQRPGILLDQFAHSPTSFQLLRPAKAFRDRVELRWRAARDPDGDALRYNLVYSADPSFPVDATTRHDGLEDTLFTLPTLPPAGRYFWKVSASDGSFYVRGFDNVTTFEVQAP